MAFIMYRELGAEPRQVIGHCGSIANANLKTLIADKLGVSAWDVTTLVIGNDGTVFPLFQYCCETVYLSINSLTRDRIASLWRL
jgi:malate/lactate dehydrogenase